MPIMAARSELGISPVLLQAIQQTLTSPGSASLTSPRETSTTAPSHRENPQGDITAVGSNIISGHSSQSNLQTTTGSFNAEIDFGTKFVLKRTMDRNGENESQSSGGVVSHLLQNLNEPVAPLLQTAHSDSPSSISSASLYEQQQVVNDNQAILTEAGLSMLGIPAVTLKQANNNPSGVAKTFEVLASKLSSTSTTQHFQQEVNRANMANSDMANFLMKQESMNETMESSHSVDATQNMNTVSHMLSAIASQHAQKNSATVNQNQQESDQENILHLSENPLSLPASASTTSNTTAGNSSNKQPIVIYSYINNDGQEVAVPVQSTDTQIILNNGCRIISSSGVASGSTKNTPGTTSTPATYKLILQPQGTPGLQGNSTTTFKQPQSGTGTVTLDLNYSQGISVTASSVASSGVMPVSDAQNTQDGMNQPCPVCGDRVSGYHYGIFTCESCKGFFKRTVQNKKNFICPKSGDCTINAQNRKKCPACRFKRCLEMGMKLEAIRQDRTRGGRSSYDGCQTHFKPRVSPLEKKIKRVTGCLPGEEEPEPSTSQEDDGSGSHSNLVAILNHNTHKQTSPSSGVPQIPELLRDIMNLEPLLSDDDLPAETITDSPFPEQAVYSYMMQLAELRLYKLVRWARNLPQFGAISTDDQILLLQNCWSELMALSLCWRSIDTPNQISISSSHHITAAWAHHLGFEDVVIQLINITDCFRRLFMDQFEYVALKVLLLITPDVKGLKEPRKIRDFQDKLLEALLTYTTSHYKNMRHKFGELLLRLPELSRISFMSKDILIKSLPSSMASCGLLVELLKGDNKGEGDGQGGLRF